MDVDLSYGGLETQSLDEAVIDHKVVRTLNLSGNGITPCGFVGMIKEHIVHMKGLEELDIKNNRIGPSGAQCLCKTLIQHCHNVRYLDVSENGIRDESLVDVAYLLSQGRIETLLLISCHITPRGIPTLCDGLLSSKYITHLSLAFNVLGDEGAAILARSLGAHPTLQSMDISDNCIGDQGAVDIAQYLILSPYSRLESIVLSVNRVGDVGFSAIAEALSRTCNTRLNHLDLGCNPDVGPVGRRALIESMHSVRHLSSLDLCSCDFSDEDMRALRDAVLSPTCGLEVIEWYNNPSMQLSTEMELEAALKLKKSIRERKDRRARQFFTAAVLAISAATFVCVSTAVLRRRRNRTFISSC